MMFNHSLHLNSTWRTKFDIWVLVSTYQGKPTLLTTLQSLLQKVCGLCLKLFYLKKTTIYMLEFHNARQSMVMYNIFLTLATNTSSNRHKSSKSSSSLYHYFANVVDQLSSTQAMPNILFKISLLPCWIHYLSTLTYHWTYLLSTPENSFMFDDILNNK